MYDDLVKLLNEHRAKAVVTCEESCLCFEIEELLYCDYLRSLEQANNASTQTAGTLSPETETVLSSESSEDDIPF